MVLKSFVLKYGHRFLVKTNRIFEIKKIKNKFDGSVIEVG
jgi:hypothetical protein